MARPRQFRLATFDDLYRQLRYAPAETRRRQMDAAEELTAEIDPDQAYPRDYVVYRITSFRPDTSATSTVDEGRAVLADLVNFVQRISSDLELRADDVQRVAIAVSELPQQLGVSTKTIQRYRDVGLVCHYITAANGKRQLVCFADALAAFQRDHGERVARGARFTRMDHDATDSIVDEARELRTTSHCSLNEAAKILAERHGRAHETIRGLLRRHDRDAEEPIFVEAGPLTARDVRLIGRAVRWGVEPARLSRRFSKSTSTVHRAIVRAQRDEARAWDVHWIALPTFELPDAEAVILGAPMVTTHLNDVVDASHAIALIEGIRAVDVPAESQMESVIAAYNLLKSRAATVQAMPASSINMTRLDAMQTDLRWATWLKWRLVSWALPAALTAIEQARHQTLESLPGDEIVSLLALAVVTMSGDVETVDPSHGHHLAPRAALAMARAMAADTMPAQSSKASARHVPGTVPLPPLFRQLTPWQDALMPSPARVVAVEALDDDARDLVSQRYGLDGTAPMTIDALASQRKQTAAHVRRSLREHERTLRQHVRDATNTGRKN
ncbi:MAG: hypothetical protein AAF432_12980 [Planctomycetota bacterium]